MATVDYCECDGTHDKNGTMCQFCRGVLESNIDIKFRFPNESELEFEEFFEEDHGAFLDNQECVF